MESNVRKGSNSITFGTGEKLSILDTPQVSSFTHENQFEESFRKATIALDNQEQAAEPFVSLPKIDPVVSAASIGSDNKAPKKSILFRTISQVELERQESLKHAEHKLENNYFKCTESNLEPVSQVLSELFKPKKVENTTQLVSPKYFEVCDSKDAKKDSLSLNNSFLEATPKRLKNENFADEQENSISYAKAESIYSNSSSSFDDIVSSSDQTDEKKAKKRRSIEMNTEERKNQIRISNREAARRCRERKRKYIDFLEEKIRILESKNEDLTKENSELKKLYKSSNGQSQSIPIILNVPNQTSNQIMLNLPDKNCHDSQSLQKVYQMLMSASR